MASLDEFYTLLQDVAKSKGDLALRIEYDSDSGVIKVTGEDTTALLRAKNGLGDVRELSYTVAEHHPFWSLLYHCSEISQTVLEKWAKDLSQKELDEIRWSIDELKNSIEKLEAKYKKDK